MNVSLVRGSGWTRVPVCAVESADGATISLALHYDSGVADGTISRRQTVLGYGWTHSYNLYLIARADQVLMATGGAAMTAFTERYDGGYTSSPGQTHTLTRVDADTFRLDEVDGSTKTFVRFDPPPWPPAGELYQLTQIEDAQGRVTTLSYNGGGRLGAVTDPYGRQVAFTYNANGRLETITNADGGITRIEYQHADDDLWRITDPLGYTIEYTYDSQNRLVREKLKDGGTWTCVYGPGSRQLLDGAGQVYVTVTNTANWAIDLEHLLQTNEARPIPGQTTVIDGRGNAEVSHYGSDSCIAQVNHADGSNSRYQYDANLRLTDKWNEQTNRWHYDYDQYGNRTHSTDPLGNLTQMFYEHATIHHLMTKRIEPDDDVWKYDYDAHGNLTKETDPIVEEPDDRVITYAYAYYPDPPPGRLQTRTRTDRNGHVTRWEYNPDGTLWREIVDPGAEPEHLNIVTEYEYDAAGRMTRQTVYRGPGLTDPVVTTYEYDAMGRLIRQVRDPGGLNLTTQYEYDGAGRALRVTNPRGVVTESEYDVRGRLVRQTRDPVTPGNPAGLNLTTWYEYDNGNNQITVIDPDGNPTRHEYDSRNRLIKTIDAEGYWTVYEYDARGNQTFIKRSINAGGPPYRSVEYRHDELSRRTHEIVDPGGLNLTTVYEYAPPGSGGGCGCGTPGTSLIHKITDPEGKVTYNYYDALDREIAVVRKVGDTDDNGGDADDAITRREYDYMANSVRVTVVNDPYPSLVTTYAYDAADRTVQHLVGPGGANVETLYRYDGGGNVVWERTAVHDEITRVYDQANRLRTETDLIGPVATYGYDENGNTLARADGLGHTWTYEHDPVDRLIKVCDPLVEVPDDKCTHRAYDANGNVVLERDNEGLVTVYAYDRLNRRTSMTKDPPPGLGVTITYEYDGSSNQTRITDDNGNATRYEYDNASRQTRELYADNTDRLFTYNGVGSVVTRTDQMDNVTTYAYDDLHRLTARTYQDGRADTFTYDRASQTLTADNDHSHVGFTYDEVGRIVSTTQTDLPQTYSYTLGYAYSTVPNTRTLSYPSGKIVVEVRDVRNRLSEVWQDAAKTAWYTYDDPDNRVRTRAYANGTYAQYEYDVDDRVTALRHMAPDGRVFAGLAHDYDAVGNRLNARNLQEVIPYNDAKPVTHSEQYGYDALYRLIGYKRGQWVADGIPNPRRHRTWQLDGVHNWQRFGIYDLDTGENALYCDSINQMNEYDDPSTDGPCPVPDDDGLPDDFMVSPCPPGLKPVTPAQVGKTAGAGAGLEGGAPQPGRGGGRPRSTGYNWRHDKNGNLVDDGVREYYYDYQTDPNSCLRSENRLTMAKDKTTGNILGQYWYDALGRRIRKLATGVATVFVVTPEWREIAEYEDGALARNYVFGDWIDDLLAVDDAVHNQRLYYHANAIGSILAVTDGAGLPAERYVYDVYGLPTVCDASGDPSPGSDVGNSCLFTGRRYDYKSTLYYHRARYLQPRAGRFITRDPKGNWVAVGSAGNSYAYCNDKPTTRLDPLGLDDTWTGNGSTSGGMIFLGYSCWWGRVTNERTGQICDIMMCCLQGGVGLGGGGGAARVKFRGAAAGADLGASGEVSGFVSASFGEGLEVGGEADTAGGTTVSVGPGVSLKAGAGLKYCWITVDKCWGGEAPVPAPKREPSASEANPYPVPGNPSECCHRYAWNKAGADLGGKISVKYDPKSHGTQTTQRPEWVQSWLHSECGHVYYCIPVYPCTDCVVRARKWGQKGGTYAAECWCECIQWYYGERMQPSP